MQFLAGIMIGLILSGSIGMAASAKEGDRTGFNRTHQEKRYDYFRERQQQQDVQNLYRQQQKEKADRTYRHQSC